MNSQERQNIKLSLYFEFEEMHKNDNPKKDKQQYDFEQMKYVERRFREILYNIKENERTKLG